MVWVTDRGLWTANGTIQTRFVCAARFAHSPFVLTDRLRIKFTHFSQRKKIFRSIFLQQLKPTHYKLAMRRIIFPIILSGFLLTLFAAAAAGDLRVLWLPNAEPDLAGYVVYYGTQPGLYTHRIEVGRQTAYTIKDLDESRRYFIAVAAVDAAGNESPFSDEVVGEAGGGSSSQGLSRWLPSQHTLSQNHPNPFHIPSERTTTITFELYEAGKAKLEIFDLLGQRVTTLVNKEFKAGRYNLSWNGRNDQNQAVHAGVYVYRLQTDRQNSTRKLVVYR
jgi:hypothetical protein